jgi:transcriptional regulator with XRE-family HTH domain
MTLGEHVLRRRLELGLMVKTAAERIGVDSQSVTAWEHGQARPRLRQYRAIFTFLGYCPVSPKPLTLGQRLWRWRRANGISRRTLATRLGLDSTTLWKLEKDTTRTPVARVIRTVSVFPGGATGERAAPRVAKGPGSRGSTWPSAGVRPDDRRVDQAAPDRLADAGGHAGSHRH